jgi:hypothetical protein
LTAILLLALAACGPDSVREDTQPVRGPTVSVGGSVGGFAGATR